MVQTHLPYLKRFIKTGFRRCRRESGHSAASLPEPACIGTLKSKVPYRDAGKPDRLFSGKPARETLAGVAKG